MQRTIKTKALAGVASLVTSYGHDSSTVAKSAGLSPEVLHQDDLQISEIQFNDLMEAAALACNDKFFLLRLANYQGWEVLGPVWPLLEPCKTISDALQTLIDYINEHLETLFLYLVTEPNGQALCFEIRAFDTWNPANLSGQLHNIDLPMAIFCNELRYHLGANWHPDYVQFSYTEPKVKAPMEKVFGKNLYFNQDVNAFHISNKDFNEPFKACSSVKLAEAAEPCKEEVQRIPIFLRVDRTIRLLLSSEKCSAQLVAEVLNMNLRTLQNQLNSSQTSYQKMYNAVRLDMAQHYLSDSELTIGAISERLKFNDSSAFSKFFMKHSGFTPRRYVRETRDSS